MEPGNTPIPDHMRRDRITGIHRLPLLAAAALPLLTIGVVAYAQYTKTSELKVAAKSSQIAISRDLIFHDRSGGVVEVRDAKSGVVLRTFGRGEGAFLRQSMRALVTTRRRHGVDERAPYRVQRDVKGMMILLDPLTETSISLNAFGKVAKENYGPLLDEKVSQAEATTTKPKI